MRRGRHKKVRYIQKMPKTAQFSPRGNPGRPDEIQLNVDHYEAIKLADHQNYNQTEGARAMGVSRATFGRILREARKIVADALTNGKTIRIRTGDTQIGVRPHNSEKSSTRSTLTTEKSTAEQDFRENILKFQPKQTS